MSLLNRGTETVTVFPEESATDADGNTITRASATGVVCRAVVQPLGSPTETLDGGFLSETKYRLRLVGWAGDVLGPQSQVEWRGNRYSIHGEPRIYNGSRRTAHVDYVLVRA
ncbi:hypothetical protein BST36_17325 [Mycolicibacterium moriokaense]|uniref:Head-to-tail stopper n=1 Tax=Mycolicibacterium moriokaense TaxID=39691 RepID=A0AAD1M966_9MYCO|nr:hypothetical protein [Mycolicibacterium moriokaense]MCV7037348.1 hypothetical protein [Mycolicibacterium moriokaense]ORB21250.1 hypothetical protein BST36_17325 [Mycolicibacterium moriokaense]BBX04306.1 hypothetical protein MMOR_52420 [Mycolicibacterium moriokaense]